MTIFGAINVAVYKIGFHYPGSGLFPIIDFLDLHEPLDTELKRCMDEDFYQIGMISKDVKAGPTNNDRVVPARNFFHDS